MRDKFVTDKFELDLRKIQIQYVEKNPRFSEDFSTKFSLPFTFYLDRDLRSKAGNYDQLNAKDLLKRYEGYHVFEGKASKATLEIIEVEGNKVNCQIDSGFEEFPNFEKMLSELPLTKKLVNNIYSHANYIYTMRFPHVDYNFPQLIYEHDTGENGWEFFEQFLNNRENNNFMENEEIGGVWRNRNIIQPMPYLLYVLKVGFQDAGYELSGDILTDESLNQKVIYSGMDYAVISSDNTTIEVQLTQDEIIKTEEINGTVYATYYKKVPVDYPGRWNIGGAVTPQGQNRIKKSEIKINEASVWSYQSSGNGTGDIQIIPFYIRDFTLYSIDENFIEFEVKTPESTSPVLNAKIWMSKQDDAGSLVNEINNLNEVNLCRSVPEMTFGDVVKTIKNWKGYDLVIEGDNVVMNKIEKAYNQPAKDATSLGVDSPKVTITDNQSFRFSFPEIDNYKIDSIFVDKEGVRLNKKAKETTTEIKIDGFCLPVRKFRGKITAHSKFAADDLLNLVDCRFTSSNLVKEHGKLMPPAVIKDMTPWYLKRVTEKTFKWSFVVNKNRFKEFSIKDTLHVKNKNFWIKEWVKTSINETTYLVEITCMELV